MADKSKNRPTVEGPAGFTPGRTPSRLDTETTTSIGTGPGDDQWDAQAENRARTERESLVNERKRAEGAAANAERAATNAERAATAAEIERNKAKNLIAKAEKKQTKIFNDTNALLEQLKTIKKTIETEMGEAREEALAAKTVTSVLRNEAGTARNESIAAKNLAEEARKNAELLRTEAERQARNAATAAGLAQSAERRVQNTATETKESARLAKEAGLQAKASANISAESAARAVETVKELNTVVANYKESLKTYTENKDAELQKKVNEQLSEITKEMNEIKSQMTKLAEEEKVTPALVASIQKSNKGIQANLSNSTINAPTNAPTNSSEYTRGKMGICFIKFEGRTNILNPYVKNQESRNRINPILPVNFNVDLEGIGDFADVSAGNYLFIDNFKLRLSDFKNMNRNEFIELILNPQEFIEFLEKLEKSSVERQFVDFRKKDLSKEDRKINKENAKIYAAKLFAAEEDFNIIYPRRPDGSGGYYFDYVIMSHEIEKKDIKGPDAFRFDVKKEEVDIPDHLMPTNTNSPEKYTFFTFKIKLILDSRDRSEITNEDLKIVGCEQRKARIYKIMGELEGTKQIITAILGPEGAKKYLVDDTKMEKLHGRVKPLPSKLKRYQRDKSILDKLSYVSQMNQRDLPLSRTNQEEALRRERIGRNSLITRRPTIGGKKKTKRIIYHKNKDKCNKKTKKGFFKKNYQKRKNTKKMIKKNIFKKTRKF
jgi:hypothetical protein